MHTLPAKPSLLGPEYHYHETGDGPDINTTDSAIDDGLHDHGIAVGLNEAVPTGGGTGPEHTHSLRREHSRAAIKGPGLGEKVNELRDHLKSSIKLISSLAAELHSSARFHNNSNHDTPSWKKCKSWLCNDARHFIEQLETEIPELKHNPMRYGKYRANLRRLQKAIKSAPPDLT